MNGEESSEKRRFIDQIRSVYRRVAMADRYQNKNGMLDPNSERWMIVSLSIFFWPAPRGFLRNKKVLWTTRRYSKARESDLGGNDDVLMTKMELD